MLEYRASPPSVTNNIYFNSDNYVIGYSYIHTMPVHPVVIVFDFYLCGENGN